MSTEQKVEATEEESTDHHADVRFFKLIEVAYNCARNGYYARAAAVAQQGIQHYQEANVDEVVGR